MDVRIIESPNGRALAKALADRRTDLAQAFYRRALEIPRFAAVNTATGTDAEAAALREFACLVDYLGSWIGAGNEDFRALYLGERAKLAYEEGDDAATRNARILTFLEADARTFSDALPAEFLPEVQAAFSDLAACFERPALKELRVLLVGDCLHLDVISFLTERLARHGTAIAPHFITEKLPVQRAARIRTLAAQPFDVIFVSPFTYTATPAFGQLLNWKSAFSSQKALIEETVAGAETVVRALAETFAAPIFVHNTAAILRQETVSNLALKVWLTKGARATVRREIDSRLDAIIGTANAATFPHVWKFDELKYLDEMPEQELGQYFYHADLQHPARLGALIARDYDLILQTVAHLLKKKMVVADLDNTLWDGVIGEGAVQHFEDRQRILKRLREKGVVLAIASKNDPANVHFRGGVLSEDDFVYSHIAWSPKVGAFPAIERGLNLKRKDFVFVDDRADERSMVEETYPEIRCFDATDDRTWAAFALWESMLVADPNMDRTKMYHEKRAREAALTGLDTAAADEAEMFASLGLKLRIWPARKGDIPRATELINRTNQFNMRASRTTFQEMSAWQAGDSHGIYLASVADKFGDMGVVSVLVSDRSDADRIEITHFVLSCRVFGYGVERALLNDLKRQMARTGKTELVGEVVPTEVNGPCQNVYAENGFIKTDGLWIYTAGSQEPIEDPAWLKVTSETGA